MFQCHLDKEGATDLVVDLIVNNHSSRIFLETVELGIALLEGGNSSIQVCFLNMYLKYSILPRCVSDRGFTRDLTTQKARQTERFSSLFIEPRRRAEVSSNELILRTLNIVLTGFIHRTTSATLWRTFWLLWTCLPRRNTGATKGIPTR